MALRRSGSSGPEQRVRATLEQRGHPITVKLGVLLATWDADARSPADRAAVGELLSGVGVKTDPPLADVSRPDDEVTLSLGATGGSLGPQAGNPRARPEAQAPPGVEPLRASEAPDGQVSGLLTAGALLVLGGLSVRWYSGERGGESSGSLTSGWEWLDRLDVLLAVVALASLVAGAAVIIKLGLSRIVPRVLLGAALLCLFLVAYRIVSPPGDAVTGVVLEISLGPGPFVTVVGLLAIALGTRLALPFGDAAEA